MSSRISPRKRAVVDYNEDKNSTTGASSAKSSGPAKKVDSKLKKAFAKTPAPKRKAEADKEEAHQKAPVAPPAPAVKKRKTKGQSGVQDTMPLAERTAVSTLGKAMYIGAHVSAAGGLS